jgi:hypothetical protein
LEERRRGLKLTARTKISARQQANRVHCGPTTVDHKIIKLQSLEEALLRGDKSRMTTVVMGHE